MILTKHAKKRAKERIEETRPMCEDAFIAYLKRLVRQSNPCTLEEVRKYFPSFRPRPDFREDTTYFLNTCSDLVIPVAGGRVITFIKINELEVQHV